MTEFLDDFLKPHEDRKLDAARRFYDANKRLEKHVARMDEKVGEMIGFMEQLENIHQDIVDVLQDIPMSDRTPVEQWILEQMIGDEANE